MIYLFIVFFLVVGWAVWCHDQVLRERLKMMNFVYSDKPNAALINEYFTTSFGSHLWYRLTFRKPPYLDRLTGVRK